MFGLSKAKYFVLGCPNLILAVYHKSLLGILGDKNLEDIENPRLFRLKEKNLRYNFTVVHVPGRKHGGADATSRHPVG